LIEAEPSVSSSASPVALVLLVWLADVVLDLLDAPDAVADAAFEVDAVLLAVFLPDDVADEDADADVADDAALAPVEAAPVACDTLTISRRLTFPATDVEDVADTEPVPV
jgi:hypothetical protein